VGTPSRSSDERYQKLLDRQGWLLKALADLRVSRERAPWVLVGNVLALPAGLLWGIAPAILVVVVAVGLWFTLWYVAWIHHHEYDIELLNLRKELKTVEAARAQGGAPEGQ
jgi:fatty acid desaturase